MQHLPAYRSARRAANIDRARPRRARRKRRRGHRRARPADSAVSSRRLGARPRSCAPEKSSGAPDSPRRPAPRCAARRLFSAHGPPPYSLLPTIVSRCLQFHFAPLPQADVEKILQDKTDRKPADRKLAAQLAEGSPGLAIEMNIEQASQQRRTALRILERAAHGEGFAQLFAETAALAKDRESPFEEQIAVFYALLSDLLELTSGVKQPVLRNAPLAKELSALANLVNTAWVMRAISGFDELYTGARRNLNRQLGLDALAASLVTTSSPNTVSPV